MATNGKDTKNNRLVSRRIHLLRYIRYKNKLGLRYYAKIEDTTISDLFIKVSIKTEKQLMVLSGS